MEPKDIPDALPPDFPDPDREGGPADDAAPGGGPSPYKNLLVPLVVVPAMIVMVLVGVWVLFGALAGDVKDPTENLERMVDGGRNERDQAAQLLVGQIYGYLEAVSAGREPEWEIDASFLPAIERAWEETEPDDAEQRYILAFFQRQLGDEAGLTHLIELLDLTDEEDPGARIRFFTVKAIGGLAPAFGEREVRVAAEALAPLLEGPDDGLRSMAAAALQRLDCPTAHQALQGALRDPRLDVRGSAAISLAHLDDPAGADVLGELLDREAYAAEHAADPRRWARAELVSQSRIQAVQALARLGRREDLARLRAAEAEVEDPNVVAEIRGALRDADAR